MTEFSYTNLSGRPSGPFVRVAKLVLPGVRRVQEQVVPFAEAWRAANLAALAAEGPLWVAIGDSMTMGIGARSIAGSWVGQLGDQLAADGERYRVVNLAVSGARVRDVIDTQLPALRSIGVEPALVTVLIGSNDMMKPAWREGLPADYAELLSLLPETAVVGTLPGRHPSALAVDQLIDDAAAAGRVGVAEMRRRELASWRGRLAEDHFHPNEAGYAGIAAAFAAGIRTHRGA